MPSKSVLADSEGMTCRSASSGARRPRRLGLQIPVIRTSLDPAYCFRKECKTAIVNAHGCGIIVPQLLNHQTPVTVELASNGATKRGRLLAIPLLEHFSWLPDLQTWPAGKCTDEEIAQLPKDGGYTLTQSASLSRTLGGRGLRVKASEVSFEASIQEPNHGTVVVLNQLTCWGF